MAGGPDGPPDASAKSRDVAAWDAAFSPALLARMVVMIGNYRCGTTLFKTTAVQFGDIHATPEPMSRFPDAAGPFSFDIFLSTVPDAPEAAMLRPAQALRAYLAWFLERVPHHRVLFDMKYGDLGRLGLTLQHAPVPSILAELGYWRVPVIHVQRSAALREAMSFLVAVRTSRFQNYADGRDGPAPEGSTVYLDPETVIAAARRCRAAHALAAEWLERLELPHYRVFYEEFRGPARKAVVMRALHASGIWCEPPATLSEYVLEQRSAERVANLAEVMDHARRTAPDLVTA